MTSGRGRAVASAYVNNVTSRLSRGLCHAGMFVRTLLRSLRTYCVARLVVAGWCKCGSIQAKVGGRCVLEWFLRSFVMLDGLLCDADVSLVTVV